MTYTEYMRKSAKYWRVFTFVFLSYFSVLISIIWVIGLAFPIVYAEFNYRRDQVLGVKYELASDTQIQTAQNIDLQTGQSNTQSASSSGGFAEIKADVNLIKPVSTDYGIVIEKINANAKIIPDIDPGNAKQYEAALSQGVAEALGSTKPGENGNLFVFSHSAQGPFAISRFNAVFYLLKELEVGDKIVIFYKGKRYTYLVYEKTVTDPKDISFLSNRYDKPVLTMQTCDPPGTLNNRLIVKAQLLGS